MAGELIGGFTALSPLERGPLSSRAQPDRRTIRIPATIAAPQASNLGHYCNAAIAAALRHGQSEATCSEVPQPGLHQMTGDRVPVRPESLTDSAVKARSDGAGCDSPWSAWWGFTGQ